MTIEQVFGLLNVIFGLLVLYQVKHFIADYPLQNEFMLAKFLPDWRFLVPLIAHAGVHSVFTFAIVLSVLPGRYIMALKLALLDFVIHFIMDRIKAGPKYLGRFKPLTAKDYPTATDEQKKGNKYFWWSLGVDQSVHHLTHYAVIYIIIVEVVRSLPWDQ